MSKGTQVNLIKNKAPEKYEALLYMLITQDVKNGRHFESDTFLEVFSSFLSSKK